MSTSAATQETTRPVSARRIMRAYWPRFARDTLGPLLAFYLGWKLGGLPLGIAVSTAVALVEYRLERRAGRPGFMARLSLGFVAVNAVAGLVSNSAVVYLALPVLQNAAFGLSFLVSAAIGRPLTGLVAREMHPIPPNVVRSATYRRVFGRSSIAWAAYLLARSGLRLWALQASVGVFVVVNLITGIPFTAALMAWSIWDGVRGFLRADARDDSERQPYGAHSEAGIRTIPAPVPTNVAWPTVTTFVSESNPSAADDPKLNLPASVPVTGSTQIRT
jgi:hypothetical protein